MAISKKSIQVREWFDESENIFGKRHDESDKYFDFFFGKQWDEADVRARQEQNKPALTINVIKAIVKLVSGLHIQNQLDIKVLPEENGDVLIADILTHLNKWQCDRNNAKWHDQLAYLSGIIGNMGVLGFDVDFSNDPIDGEIKIYSEDPRDIYPDPCFKQYDMSDAEFICRRRKWTKSKIIEQFPETSDDIPFEEVEKKFSYDVDTSYVNSSKIVRYNVIECFWKKQIKREYFVVRELGIFSEIKNGFTVIGGDAVPIELLKEKSVVKYEIIERKVPIIRRTVIIGNHELVDEDSIFGEHPYLDSHFPIICFFPLFVFGNYSGIVADLVDVQKEKNQRRSQLLHLINQSANTGWWHQEGALKDPKILRDFGSRPGIVLEAEDGMAYNVNFGRLNPAVVPAYVANAEQLASATLKEVSGVNPDMLGFPEKTSSGRAIALRQQQGMTILANEDEAFTFTKKLFGKYLTALIQKFMSPKQIFNIIGREFTGEEDSLFQRIKNYNTMKYDISIEQRQFSPTYRFANFADAMNMYQTLGPDVMPVDILVELSDIPSKEKILERLRAGAQPQPVDMQNRNQLTQGLTKLVKGSE